MDSIPEISNHSFQTEVEKWKLNFIMLIYAGYVIQFPSIAWQTKPIWCMKEKIFYYVHGYWRWGIQAECQQAWLIVSDSWYLETLTGKLSMAGSNWGLRSFGCLFICICDKTEFGEFKGHAQLAPSIEVLAVGPALTRSMWLGHPCGMVTLG